MLEPCEPDHADTGSASRRGDVGRPGRVFPRVVPQANHETHVVAYRVVNPKNWLLTTFLIGTGIRGNSSRVSRYVVGKTRRLSDQRARFCRSLMASFGQRTTCVVVDRRF